MHGLTAVELGAGVFVDDRSAIKTDRRQFLIHNYFPPPDEPFVLNLASPDDAIRARSLDHVLAALDLAARLGAPYYSVHAGFVVDPIDIGPGSFRFPPISGESEAAHAMERFIAAIKPAVAHAEKVGVGLLVENNVCIVENRGKLLLQTADEFIQLLDACRSDSLGVLLDTGHLNVTARTFHLDRTAFVDALGPYAKVIHIHDNDGIVDTHDPVGPRSWALDILRRPDLADVPVVVEARFDDIDSLVKHMAWLKCEVMAGG